jgi:hypothetical protein
VGALAMEQEITQEGIRLKVGKPLQRSIVIESLTRAKEP